MSLQSRRFARCVAVLVLLIVTAMPSSAKEVDAQLATLADPVKSVRAHALQPGEVLTLDGRLDDAVWTRIAPILDFRMQEPVEGGAPSEGRARAMTSRPTSRCVRWPAST